MKKILSIFFLFTLIATQTGCEVSNESTQSFTDYLHYLGNTQKEISNKVTDKVLDKAGIQEGQSFSIREIITGWFNS